VNILGISAYYHDSAAALVRNGKIIAAVQEERFTRKKHDASFPSNAIKFCLQHSGLRLLDLDAIVFYDKPLLKFERLLETYYAYAPKGFLSFFKAMPVWMKEKIFLKKLIRDELKKIDPAFTQKIKIQFPEHHLSHAASAFYPSPFTNAAIVTIDGVGEWATTTICKGHENKIEILKQLNFPHSVGLLYSAFTYYLGFKVNSGEYKLMGLAPYGNTESEETLSFISTIKNKLVTIYSDGSVLLNMDYFNYPVGLTMVKDQVFEKLFGLSKRNPADELNEHHCNLALAIQIVTEEIVLKMAAHAKQLTGSENLCLAGGVALNCVANGKIENSGLFKNVFIQPAAGDAGGANGAALASNYIYFEKERLTANNTETESYCLGPSYSAREIELMCRKFNAVSEDFELFEDLCAVTATQLKDGKVVGWFQGRTEFGPRALGNRSILADARNKDMQLQLNLKIKFRESFRPFAPAVLAEYAADYFELNSASPYMLLVQPVKNEFRNDLPENYSSLSLKEKLNTTRSQFPAITHVDFSARIQTVHKESSPQFHQLIAVFKELTGCPMLVNTSFNVKGEPIVNTPEEAYLCFMNTGMDVLVINNYIFYKEKQPELAAEWKQREFEDD
jgi:carbamoyltransferase